MNQLPALIIASAFSCCLCAASCLSTATALKPASLPRSEVIAVSTSAASDDAAPVPNEPAAVATTTTTAEAQDAVEPEAVSFANHKSPKVIDIGGLSRIDEQQELFTQPAAPPVPAMPVATQARTVYVTRPTFTRYYSQSCGPGGCSTGYSGRRIFRRR